MALEKIRLGTNEDGTPHYLYRESDPGRSLVYTGPNITGSVSLPDGTVYDVTDLYTSVEVGHELLVSDAVGQRFATEGHPAHDADEPFVHTPSAASHGKDGRPAPAFADAVHANAPAGKDSSPAGVLAAVKKG